MELAMAIMEIAVEAAIVSACIVKWWCRGPYDG